VPGRLGTPDWTGLTIPAATAASASNVRRARDEHHVPRLIGYFNAGHGCFEVVSRPKVQRARAGGDDHSANGD